MYRLCFIVVKDYSGLDLGEGGGGGGELGVSTPLFSNV